MNQLPDDILFMIFSHFDVGKLMEIEIVCKRWKNVSRSNKSFWKSLPHLHETTTVKRINHLIELVRKRGNGTIPSLNAPINILNGEFEEIKRFCKILPELKVVRLSVDLTPNVDEVDEVDDNFSDDEEYHKFRKYQKLGKLMREGEFLDASNEILEAIAHCSNLELLSISTKFDDYPASFPSDLASKPISNCRLKTFLLCGIDPDNFFDQSIAFQILSKADTVKIKGDHELSGVEILERFDGPFNNLKHLSIIRSSEQKVYRSFFYEVETSKELFDEAAYQSDDEILELWSGSKSDEGDRLITILQGSLNIGREKILLYEGDDDNDVVVKVLLSESLV